MAETWSSLSLASRTSHHGHFEGARTPTCTHPSSLFALSSGSSFSAARSRSFSLSLRLDVLPADTLLAIPGLGLVVGLGGGGPPTLPVGLLSPAAYSFRFSVIVLISNPPAELPVELTIRRGVPVPPDPTPTPSSRTSLVGRDFPPSDLAIERLRDSDALLSDISDRGRDRA